MALLRIRSCRQPHGRRQPLIAVALLTVIASTAVAQTTVTWNGTTDTTWTQPDATSWSSATYQSGDTALFNGSGTGTVTIDAGGVTPGQVNVTSGDYTFSGGGIGGSGGIAKSGAGTLTLTAANTYSGSTSVTAGALKIQNATALGGTAAGTTVSSGAALELQGGITVSGESLSLGGGGIASDGALRNMSGTNTWAGSVLTTGSTANRVHSTAGRIVLSGPVSIAANNGLLVMQGDGNGEISGNITGGVAGVLTLARGGIGSGTWTLSGSNTYLGYTVINTHNVIAAGGFAIPDTSLTYLMAAGRLTLNANETIGSLTSDSASSRVDLNSNTLTVGADNSNPVDPNGQTAFQGSFIGTGGIVKVGTGRLTLSGSSSFNGSTVINSGTLLVGNAGAFGASSNTLAVNGGRLDLGGFSPTVAALSGSSGATITTTSVSGTATLTSSFASGSSTYAGVIADNGSGRVAITKAGGGTLILAGGAANTHTGLTSVTGGVLHLSKTSGNAVGGNLSISNARVTFSGSNQIADGAAVTMSGASSVFNGTAWSAGMTAVDDTFSSLTVSGGVYNSGFGLITVTGSASFTGGVGNTEFVGNSGGLTSFGSLALVGMTGSTAPAVASPNTFRLAGNGARFTELLIGSGGLSLDGSSILLGIGTGSSAIGSRVVLNGDVTTLGSSESNIMPPAAFDNTFGSRMVALSGTAGSVTRSFTIGGGGANLNVLVPVTNGSATTAGIRKLGSGILTLGTASTYTGATTIAAGTLALGAAGSFANSPVITVGDAGSAGAVLDISAKTGTFTFIGSQTVGGIGTLKMDAGDTARFAGTFAPGTSPGIFTLDGGTTLLSGTTQIEIFGSARGTGYDAVDLLNAATLNYSSGVLALDFGSWLADQQSYQLFGNGSSSLLGGFSSVTIAGSNYTGLTFTGSNGVWTSQGTSPANQTLTFTEATGTLVIVPEPGALALAGFGLIAAAALARRRSRGASSP